MSLTGKTKAGSYKDLLQMNNSNNGVDATTRNVVDGEGTASAISLSDDEFVIQPQNNDTIRPFIVRDKDGNGLFSVDSTNDVVRAGIGANIVNTQIKEFGISSSFSLPHAVNTWTAISMGTAESQARLEFGTSSTPSTSYTIDLNADDMVVHMWHIPFDITIDQCRVWFGGDAASGDVVKFSVMSYTIDTDNGSTGGDLSSGVENCVSPSTITGAGYEQAYYQSLTISTADVDRNKVIMAFVSQDGSNSDLSIHMQLVYHLR